MEEELKSSIVSILPADQASSKQEEKRGIRDEKGRFLPGVSGHPGRVPGSKNKFTAFKEQMIDLWEEENCKEKMRSQLNNPRTFWKVIETMVAILPKDDPDANKSEKVQNITVVVVNNQGKDVKDVQNNAGAGSDQGNSLEAQASRMLGQ